jgi:hypothetical protein
MYRPTGGQVLGAGTVRQEIPERKHVLAAPNIDAFVEALLAAKARGSVQAPKRVAAEQDRSGRAHDER